MAVKLKIRAFEHGDVFELADIPRELWDEFCRRCEQILPEHKDTGQAWAALISNLISSVLDAGEHVFVMTGIPRDSWQALCETLGNVEERPDTVLAKLITAARDERLHGGSMIDMKSKSRNRHTLLITGIPQEAIGNLTALGDAGETMLGITEAAAKGQLTLKRAKPKKGGA